MTQLRKCTTVCKAGETFNFSFMSCDRTRGKFDGVITVHRTRLRPHGHEQKMDNVKFRVFPQEFPEIGSRIDSAYHAAPQGVIHCGETGGRATAYPVGEGKKEGNRSH